MKTLFTLLFLGISLTSFTQADCSLDLKTVYAFEPGDEFTYILTNYDWTTGTGEPYVQRDIVSFKVNNKYVNGDTIRYIVTGYIPHNFSTKKDYNPFIGIYSGDSLILLDTINHILNKCSDSLVKFNTVDGTIYSFVNMQSIDSVKYKILGGLDNLYTYNHTDYVPFFDFKYEEKYSAGLGLVYQDVIYFEHRKTLELANYVKNGNKTVLLTSTDNSLKESNFDVFPNPVIDKLIINFDGLGNKMQVKIMDSFGQIVYSENPSFFNKQHFIDFTSFKSGLYIVELLINEKKLTRKILKQ